MTKQLFPRSYKRQCLFYHKPTSASLLWHNHFSPIYQFSILKKQKRHPSHMFTYMMQKQETQTDQHQKPHPFSHFVLSYKRFHLISLCILFLMVFKNNQPTNQQLTNQPTTNHRPVRPSFPFNNICALWMYGYRCCCSSAVTTKKTSPISGPDNNYNNHMRH